MYYCNKKNSKKINTNNNKEKKKKRISMIIFIIIVRSRLKWEEGKKYGVEKNNYIILTQH